MQLLRDLIANEALFIPLLAWALAQLSKLAVNLIVEHRLELRRALSDGGMPSGHSATVTALMIVVGWQCGLASAPFALAAIFAAVVMRDAMGVRREAGMQAKTIKEMTQVINDMLLQRDKHIRVEKLKELVGHTPLQVFFGMLLGATVAIVYCLAVGMEYGSPLN